MAELESFWLELAEPKAKSEGVCDAGVAKSKEAADSDFPPFSEPFDGFFKKSKLAAASGSGAPPEVVFPNPAKPANRLGPPSLNKKKIFFSNLVLFSAKVKSRLQNCKVHIF